MKEKVVAADFQHCTISNTFLFVCLPLQTTFKLKNGQAFGRKWLPVNDNKNEIATGVFAVIDSVVSCSTEIKPSARKWNQQARDQYEKWAQAARLYEVGIPGDS